MTDWKAIARAGGLDLPDSYLDSALAPLKRLEKEFAAEAEKLRPEDDPAVVFKPLPEDGR